MSLQLLILPLLVGPSASGDYINSVIRTQKVQELALISSQRAETAEWLELCHKEIREERPPIYCTMVLAQSESERIWHLRMRKRILMACHADPSRSLSLPQPAKILMRASSLPEACQKRLARAIALARYRDFLGVEID